MKRATGQIDWIVVEEEEAWQGLQKTTPIELSRKSLHPKEVALAVFIALFVLFLVGGWFWPHHEPMQGIGDLHQNDARQAEMSLTQTLARADPSLGIAGLHSAKANAMAQGTAQAPKEGQLLKVDNLQQLGNRMMAQITVQHFEGSQLRAYRETRFYEGSANEWQRIPPDPALLGEQQTLTIANFIILYRDVDADAVYSAAPRLEQFFAGLRQDFGVPAAGAGSPYTIEIVADRADPFIAFLTHHHIVIPSPTLLSAPVEMPAATLIVQETIYPLTRMMLLQSVDSRDVAWKYHFIIWRPFIEAIVLWEVWQAGGPLADARDPLVHWLYETSQATTQPRLLPTGYDALCRPYQILQIVRRDLPPPLTCTKADQDSASWQYLAPLTRLREATSQGETRSGAEGPYAVEVTGETVVEYIVATYGRDKLPALLNALGEHRTLDTLIPALFGVPLTDFEEGWQTYLAEQYGVALHAR